MPSALAAALSMCGASTRWPSSGCRRHRPGPRVRPAGRKDPGIRFRLRPRDPRRVRRLRVRRRDLPDPLHRGRESRAQAAASLPGPGGPLGLPYGHQQRRDPGQRPHHHQPGSRLVLRIGTATSKGTKIFSLVGKINNTGLIEVPMGITLREIVYDIGGGIPGNKQFKAVQTGGPSGGCIPRASSTSPSITRA